MMAPGYEEGFVFLRNTAIDQHVIERRRFDDMVDVIGAHRELLGIGIDEAAAIVVQGYCLEVIGRSEVAIYESKRLLDTAVRPYLLLSPGDRFDMRSRTALSGRARN